MSCVLPREIKQKMKDAIEETKKTNKEHSFLIFSEFDKNKKEKLTTSETYVGHPGSFRIKTRIYKNLIGDFHTHPHTEDEIKDLEKANDPNINTLTPSAPDIKSSKMAKLLYFCIGSPYKTKIQKFNLECFDAQKSYETKKEVFIKSLCEDIL